MCNGISDRMVEGRALGLGQCLCVTLQGSCRALPDAAFVQIDLLQCWRSSVWGGLSLMERETGGEDIVSPHWGAALVQGSLQHCCRCDAWCTHSNEALVVLRVCDGWRYRALQAGHHACAAVCVPTDPVPTVTAVVADGCEP